MSGEWNICQGARLFVKAGPGALDPLRREILAGRPVVAATEGSLEGHVREAVAVAGRAADLVVVHLHDAWLKTTVFGPESRAFPLPETAAPGTGRGPGWQGARDLAVPPELDWLPPLDLDALDPARAVVLVVGVGGYPLKLLAERLRRRLGERARAAGWWCVPFFRDYAHKDRVPALVPRDDMSVVVEGQEGALERAERAVPGEAEAWDAGRRRALSGIAIEGEDGLFHAEVGGRLVVAFRRGIPEWYGASDVPRGFFGCRTRIGAYELSPDGWLAGADLMHWPEDDGALRDAVAALALGGLSLAAQLRRSRREDFYGASRVVWDADAADAAGFGPLRRFLEGRLDAPLLRVLHDNCHAHPLLNRVALGPDGGARRRQFALAYPAVADLLYDDRFAAAVDGGARAVPLVAGALDVTPAAARRLGGATGMPSRLRACVRLGQRAAGVDSVNLLGPILRAFPTDRLPPRGDGEGWWAFLDCVAMCDRVAERLLLTTDSASWMVPLALGIRGPTWVERNGNMRRAVADPREAVDAGDLVLGFAHWIGRMTDDPCTAAVALSLLAGHGSLTRLVEASRRWHADPTLRSGGTLAPETAWPVPFDRVDLEGGWRVVPVADQAALIAEGEAMDHCVAGYGPACLSGESLVLSLRRIGADGVETRVSTAELRRDGTGWRIGDEAYGLVQHRGAGNGDPGSEAGRCLDRLRDGLASGAVPSRPLPDEGPASAEEHRGAAGAERDLDAWRRVLPRSLAALDLPDLMARVHVEVVAFRTARDRAA